MNNNIFQDIKGNPTSIEKCGKNIFSTKRGVVKEKQIKFKFLTLFVTIGIATNSLFAQEKLKPLKHGDVVSQDLSLGKVINYLTKTAKISDFKGKLIILDFWSTHCFPCVRALPKLDSLQKKFEKQIAILPVSREPEDKIFSFFKNKNISLTSIVENRELEKLFPFQGVPFEVWIDQNGKVIATTNEGEVNSKNIEKYLNSGKLDVKQRLDVLDVKFDMDEDLFVNGNGGSGHFLWRSILTNKIEGLGGNYAIIKKPDTKSKINFSATAYNLYFEVLYKDVRRHNPNLFFIESDNSERKNLTQCDLTKTLDFFYKNVIPLKEYCYNLTVPSSISDSLLYRKYMLEDLNRYFNLDAKIEKQKVSSWILIKAKNKTLSLVPRDNKSISTIDMDDDIEGNFCESMRNITLEDLIESVHEIWMICPPMFNETGYVNDKINLNNLHLKYRKDEAYYKPLNLEEWRAAFQRNGLDIKVEDREVEVMVFKKKDTPSK